MKKAKEFLDDLYWYGQEYENGMRSLFSKEAFRELKETLDQCDRSTKIILIGCILAIPCLVGLAILSRLF